MLRARLILASLGLAFLAIISLGVNAQDTKTTPQGNKDDIITSEQQLARQFGEFVDALLPPGTRRRRGYGKVLADIKRIIPCKTQGPMSSNRAKHG